MSYHITHKTMYVNIRLCLNISQIVTKSVILGPLHRFKLEKFKHMLLLTHPLLLTWFNLNPSIDK